MYCVAHAARSKETRDRAATCVEQTCAKPKALGLQRCRACHFARYGQDELSLLRSQPWWSVLERYIEGRIQMGIRQALKNVQD